jgi:hypothetical protein
VLKIGVKLQLDRDAGELFADARALEAAGADSLWVSGERDQPFVVLAALAAATSRARLVALGPYAGPPPHSEEVIDRRPRDTCERLARGRMLMAVESLSVETGPPEQVSPRFLRERDEFPESERWAIATIPQGRAAWRELLAAYEAGGATGIVVPNDPRLLDLLRNPNTEDDRQDLKLAFG